MMSSQSRSLTMDNTMIKETLFNEEFIGYINSLSRAILDFYKVSNNIHSNKDLLINYGKNELINHHNNNINENNNLKNEFIELIQSLSEIFNKLEFNNTSQKSNLANFFADAKILFKRLKEKRQEIISKMRAHTQRNKNLDIPNSSKNSGNKRNKTLDHPNNFGHMAKSYHNINLKKMEPDIIGSDFSKNKSVNLAEENGMNLDEKRGKSQHRQKALIKDEYFHTDNNNVNSKSEFGIKTPNLNMNNNYNKLKPKNVINKKFSSDFAKNKSKGLDNINMGNNYTNSNNFKNINLLIREKDKIISTLKEEINNINKKHQMILNQYNKELFSLRNEIERNKTNASSSINNIKNDNEKNLYLKLNNLMKENKILKDNIEALKMNNNNNNDFNSNIGQKLTLLENLNNNSNKENTALRNKIKILENKFKQKQFENNELNKKIILLKQQYDSAISNLSNQNNELSMNLMNMNGQQPGNEFNLNLNQKISELNEEIKEKDNKLSEINYQLEQIHSQYLLKEAENQKLLKVIETMKINKEKNVKSNTNINDLNEKLEEQQNLNNDLNEELTKVKNDNELLRNKILSNEKRISVLKNNEDMQNIKDKEFDKLKNENKSLKFENEKLNYNYTQLKENIMSKDDDKVKKQEDEIEGLKQLIQKMQNERETLDKELSSLKRENEKIKNQMMRLSKTLPEEYNELQKQYNELENKYISLKNKNVSGTTPKKAKPDEKQDDNKYAKELTEAKKQIEQLKKKNVDLVTQLEDKEINKNYYDTRSEDANKSNYEEEFDLRKMAKGAKDKNRSQDINIDYPGILTYKEKLRELEFYYNSLETLVKKLLLTIQCTPKNKTYVVELCRIVGFDLETTNKIVNNKNKNFILGLFK